MSSRAQASCGVRGSLGESLVGKAKLTYNLVKTRVNSHSYGKWPIEIDGLPINSMVIFYSYVRLPEGKGNIFKGVYEPTYDRGVFNRAPHLVCSCWLLKYVLTFFLWLNQKKVRTYLLKYVIEICSCWLFQ